MITITVDRQSVCAGDDTSSHSDVFTISDTSTINDLINHLLTRSYLPCVSGHHHWWEMTIENEVVAVVKANNSFAEQTSLLPQKLLKFSKNDQLYVYFHYHWASS